MDIMINLSNITFLPRNYYTHRLETPAANARFFENIQK